MYLKNIFKKILPEKLFNNLLVYNRKFKNFSHHYRQSISKIQIGNYIIKIPSKHLLIKIIKEQPIRDLFIGELAKIVTNKYPNREIIDIGANIGDTASIISSKSNATLILVEPSNYYFNFLTKNAKDFPNKTILYNCMILDGEKIDGLLIHWGGTAFFNESNIENKILTKKISEISTNPSLIKIDTDGHDYKIINSNLDFIKIQIPILIFEIQIENDNDFNDITNLLFNLTSIGYTNFSLFDDQGFCLINTNDIKYITMLNSYLLKQILLKTFRKSISNYDICCFHKSEQDLFDSFSNIYKK